MFNIDIAVIASLIAVICALVAVVVSRKSKNSRGLLPDPSAEVIRVALSGDRVGAIKQYRKETSSGLRDATKIVDKIMNAENQGRV